MTSALPSDSPILITGGAGFIGSHLAAHLVSLGIPTRVLDLPAACTRRAFASRVDVIPGDIRHESDLIRAARGCSTVIHLAGNPHLFAVDPTAFAEINHQGTRRVLQVARTLNIRRFVHVSTESIVASPDPEVVADEDAVLPLSAMRGSYLRSKWLAEAAARAAAAAGAPVIIARPSIPIGPADNHQGPLTRAIRAFVAGRVFGYLPGTLDFIDVRDLAVGLAATAFRGQPGHTYLLTGESLTYTEFFRRLSAIVGRPAPTFQVPYCVALAYAYAGEVLARHLTGHIPLASVTGVRLTRRSFQFNASRTRAELRLLPHSCTQALRDTVAWLAHSPPAAIVAPAAS